MSVTVRRTWEAARGDERIRHDPSEHAAGGVAPAAYLSFSEAYGRPRDQAAAWGWPVSTLTGTHLGSLADPHGPSAAIAELLGRLGLPRPDHRADI